MGNTILTCVVAFAALCAGAAFADEIPAKDGATAQWMITKERAWANMACGGE
jgi:hypothetical protein